VIVEKRPPCAGAARVTDGVDEDRFHGDNGPVYGNQYYLSSVGAKQWAGQL
jgi:hypothetical protein